MVIFKIEEKETRLFETKTKTNFSVCFHLLKPEEYLMRSSWTLEDNIDKKIRTICKKIISLELKQSQTCEEVLIGPRKKAKVNRSKKKLPMPDLRASLLSQNISDNYPGRESRTRTKTQDIHFGLFEGTSEAHSHRSPKMRRKSMHMDLNQNLLGFAKHDEQEDENGRYSTLMRPHEDTITNVILSVNNISSSDLSK